MRAEDDRSQNLPVPELTLWHFLSWCLGRRSRLRVVNRSMLPVLQPGDEVLIDPRAYGDCLPQVGDRVVALHPHQPGLRIIKCIAAVRDSECFLVGENPAQSSDSRSFGWVQVDLLQGKVVCRFGRGQV
ncbi:MAG: nickel-type superoxide dismutase maturation protease [Synechococcales cyanobacterium CRU_2_2]|nr:nickel-type superoxide dismutase maturation protease [Synechococcales cyanobacterium CRU_2_2]